MSYLATMANKILADLGISPFSKFLVVYWLSLGLIIVDQLILTVQGQWIPIFTGQPILNPDGSVAGTITLAGEPIGVAIGLIAAVLILYGAYLLYNRQKRGALIAIATNLVVVAYFVFILGQTPIPLEWVAVYVVAYIVIVAGPTLLFPEEYS